MPPTPAASTPDRGAPTVLKHTRFEDIVGLITGVVVISFALFILRSGGVVSGGTAGLSLLLNMVIPVQFGIIFVVVNVPFFLLAARGKGLSFVVRSGLSILGVATLTSLHGQSWAFGELRLEPAYAAVIGNVLCGIGLLILFRHNSSLGGFNIVALLAQERFGLRAGYVLLALDGIVVLASAFITPPTTVVFSALGVLIIGMVLAQNHRPGRYYGG